MPGATGLGQRTRIIFAPDWLLALTAQLNKITKTIVIELVTWIKLGDPATRYLDWVEGK